jgi:hypothetical protein
MPVAYEIEVWSDGSTHQLFPNLEFNHLVYEPREIFDSKAHALAEAFAIRFMENRWARPVKMEDGRWAVYASMATKEAN